MNMDKCDSKLEQSYEIPVINNDCIVDQQQFTIELQQYYSRHKDNSKKSEWTCEKVLNVIKLIDDYNLAKIQKRKPSSKQYHHANKYDVLNIGNEKVLLMKRKCYNDPVIQIIPSNEYYQKILYTHIATGHGRRDKIVQTLRNKYLVPIFAITIFLKLCKICQSKKDYSKSGSAMKQLGLDNVNRRGLVVFIDFQNSPDNEYKWLMQYQDELTKFSFLRPLRSKEIKEVAIELLKIFLEVGCPNILQSDIGREFTTLVLREIERLWPVCKIINGRPRLPQSKESIESSIQEVKKMICNWMEDNNSTNWSIGCHFVQFHKNTLHNGTISKTPYKAFFGHDLSLGLNSTHLPENVISKLETEEDIGKYYDEINNSENLLSIEMNMSADDNSDVSFDAHENCV